MEGSLGISISLVSSLHRPNSNFPSQTHFFNPFISAKAPTTGSGTRRKSFHAKSRSSKDSTESSSKYFDEDGVVDDMDGYLNYLSLEYDSVWDTKPSWCQPWTITLTGVLVIGGSWLVIHSAAFTAFVCLLIGAWWYIFLYSYPKEYTSMIADRRKNVRSGVEDTFGTRKSQ